MTPKESMSVNQGVRMTNQSTITKELCLTSVFLTDYTQAWPNC